MKPDNQPAASMRPFHRPAKRRGLLLSGIIVGVMAATIPLAVKYATQTAYAQSGRGAIIIRDTEIENWLREWSSPVIRAAQLDPRAINFILVQDNNLNAFVAGGQNIFIYTGLLQRADNASEVVGVIAHELGHIRGGHLIRLGDALERAGYETILGTLLGIGTAIITGNGQAAAAVASGVSGMAASRFMSFSRIQESSADQAGLTYLQQAGLSAQGLVSFMEKLSDQELLPPSQQSAYIRTHPLTIDRIEALSTGLSRSPSANKPEPAQWADEHARMKAKLIGFISPERVTWDYGSHDQSMAARYARTIAAYRQNHIDQALSGINDLLAAEPNNAYLHELKGQMLVDFSRVAEALPSYKKAVTLDPKAPLIRIAYAHALIENAGHNDKTALNEAITQLERARSEEPRATRINRLLATAYGRLGDDAAAKVYLAEEAVQKGEMKYAKRQAEAALATLAPGSKHRIRAQDIISYVDQNPEKE